MRKTATRIILGLLGLVALAPLLDGMAAVFQPTFEPGDASGATPRPRTVR